MGWKSYKYRLIPWLAVNWSTRLVKKVEAKCGVQREAEALKQLFLVCNALQRCFPPAFTVRDWKRIAATHNGEEAPWSVASSAMRAKEVLQKECGVSLSLRQSEVGGAGVGVFTDADVGEGKLVGLYPGTVYLPFEPIFFQSLGNSFLFRCSNGDMIDGKCSGLSKHIFTSCAYRDLVGGVLSCDPSWLMKSSALNPLSIGQFVNNHTRTVDSNVEYVEVEIPTDFPHSWRRFLPNVFYSSSNSDFTPRQLVMIALCTTRPVKAQEELLSSYFTIVTD